MKSPSRILQETLHHPDPLVAAEAARLMGDWGGHALIPALIENARFSRFYSKVAAIYALARLSAREAIPHLKNLVSDPNVSNDSYWYGAKGVRAAAAFGLLQLGNEEGVPYLLELATAGDEVFVRWFAPALLRLKAPAELQSHLTLEKLCSAEKQKAYAGADYSEPGRLCLLCEALELIPDPEAEARLQFYFGHYSRFVRGQAYRSLYRRRPVVPVARTIADNAGRHGTNFDLLVSAEIQKDAGALLEIARRAPSSFDRGSALDALAAIFAPALLEAAPPALEDPDPYVRQCAVEALARNHGVAARKYFAGLAEREKEVRVRCALAATQLKESSC